MDTREISANKYYRMTHLPVERLIVSLAIPTILSMLVSSIYSMADTYFVGQLGTSATGGVGICFSVMAIIQAIGFTFGQGAGNTVSRLLGRQDQKSADIFAATGFFTAFGLSAALAIAGFFFVTPLVRFLGATETIAPYAADYLRYLFIGMPFIASSFVLNNLLRYQGSAVYAMFGILAGAVLNIGLDPLFIFTFRLGVSGAAIATAISQVVSFIILLLQSARGGNIRPRFRNFRWDGHVHLVIFKNGAPALLRQGLVSVVFILLNTAAATFSDAAVAAIAIVMRVFMFAMSALIGFGQGFQPVCGFNYGAGRYDRVRQAFWFCVRTSAVVLLVVGAIGFIFAPQIMAAFRKDDPAVIQIGALALRCQFVTFPLASFTILAMMMTQTMGISGKASLLALARQGLFFIPLVLVLPRTIGLLGVQISQPISDLFSFFLSLILTLPVLRGLRQNPPPEANRLPDSAERADPASN